MRRRRRRRLGLCLLLGLGIAAAGPAAASATTLVSASDGGALSITAAPGEVNTIVVTQASSGVVEIDDTTADMATVTAPPCATDGNTVLCTGEFPVVTVGLGDGDDSLDMTHPDLTTASGSLTNSGSSIAAGAGDESVTTGNVDDEIDEGASPNGADSFAPGGGDNALDYSARTAAVTITAGAGADDGEAGEGDDAGPGFDAFRTGAGDDSLTGAAAVELLNGGNGDDAISGGGGGDTEQGGRGDDSFDQGPSDDGDDSIVGGELGELAGDTVDYGRRSGSIVTAVTGTGGEDGVESNDHAEIENLDGGSGGDVLAGDSSANRIRGASGDDELGGRGGADTELGGPGDDALGDLSGFGADLGADRLDGGDGSEADGDLATYGMRGAAVTAEIGTASGNGNDDDDAGDDLETGIESLEGGTAGDTLVGDGGANALAGGGSGDVLRGRLGADLLTGGSGGDTADYSERGSSGGVVVDLTSPAPGSDPDSEDEFGDAIELLSGGAGDDRLTGNALENAVSGGGGDDEIGGGDGTEDDVLAGDGGHDAASYAGRAGGVRVELGAGTGGGIGSGEADDLGTEVESAIGGDGADELIGDGRSNALTGGPGQDLLELGAAVDFAGAQDGEVDTIDCTGGGPDIADVDGAAPAETYIGCDADGDGSLDFFDSCPTQAGTAGGCPVAVAPAPVATEPAAGGKKKKRCKKGEGKKKKRCKKKGDGKKDD